MCLLRCFVDDIPTASQGKPVEVYQADQPVASRCEYWSLMRRGLPQLWRYGFLGFAGSTVSSAINIG
jgi:hypothetical protein